MSCTVSTPLSLILPLAQECFSSVASLFFSYLWFSVTSLRFHSRFAYHQLQSVIPPFSDHEGYPALVISRRDLRLCLPFLSSSDRYRPVAHLQLPSASSVGISLPGASSCPRYCHSRILGYALVWYCTGSSIDVNALGSSNYLLPAYVCAILIGPHQKMFLYFCFWFRFSGYFPFLPVDYWFLFC